MHVAVIKKLDAAIARHRNISEERRELIMRAGVSASDGELTRVSDLERAEKKASDEIERLRADVNEVINAGGMDASVEIAGFDAGTDAPKRRGRGRSADVSRAVWDADIARMGSAEIADHASRVLDATHSRKLDRMPDQAFDKVERMLNSSSASEVNRAAQWAIAASDPAYESAFAKMVVDPVRGHLEWDSTEQRAYAVATNVARAMSLTDANGGFMVPISLDPAILLTNDGSNNPLRQLATVKQITTDTWNGITSAGATSEWKTEASEVADGSPTLAQPSIPTFFGDSFVPYSFEYGMDAEDAMTELSRILVDSADNLMATAYTTGNGTTAPQGIVTGLAGTASEINGGGTEAIIAADAYSLQNDLPARFSANATWQANIATWNTFKQFETTNGAIAFPELRDNPPFLLGKAAYENSNLDGAINAAATANNYVAVYGDVRAGFYIVDRIGATLELIPNLVGANQRPTGSRGALLWFRTGSEVVIPEALRLLDIPTTA